MHLAPAAAFDDVRRIAVLRGGGLGDLLLVEPAIRALAHAYPEAEITLLGTPLAKSLLDGRPGPVSRVEVLPIVRGVRDGEDEDDAVTAAFLARMASQRFDLAVQLHGGGRYSNPFLLRLQARHTVGMVTPDAARLERTLPYVYYQHGMFRALEVVALAGAAPVTLDPVVQVTSGEHAHAAALVGDEPGPLLAVHPGATDPRRRWPAERFGMVASHAVADGARVVIVGDGSDSAKASAIIAAARRQLGVTRAEERITDFTGRLGIGELAGLLARTDVMLGNDSGPRHLAQAVGAATVGVFWVGNLINAGPLTRRRHRARVSWTTRCPVCDRDVTRETTPRCAHDVSFVTDVAASAVADDVRELMAMTPPPRG